MATYEAVLSGAVIARSDATVVVEGNHYFPLDAVRTDVLRPTGSTSICPWKGRAHYYTLEVEGRSAADAAWTYRHPSPAARRIKNHVAFGSPVEVVEVAEVG